MGSSTAATACLCWVVSAIILKGLGGARGDTGIQYTSFLPDLDIRQVDRYEMVLDVAELETTDFTPFLAPDNGLTSAGRIKAFDFISCENKCEFELRYANGDKPKKIHLDKGKVKPKVMNKLIKRQGLKVGNPNCDSEWCVPRDFIYSKTKRSVRNKREVECQLMTNYAFYFIPVGWAQHCTGGAITATEYEKKIQDVDDYQKKAQRTLELRILNLLDKLKDIAIQTTGKTNSVLTKLENTLQTFGANLTSQTTELGVLQKKLVQQRAEIVANQVYNTAEAYYEAVRDFFNSFIYRLKLRGYATTCATGISCKQLMIHLAEKRPEIGILLSLDYDFQPAVLLGDTEIRITYLIPSNYRYSSVLAAFQPPILLTHGCKEYKERVWCSKCFRQNYKRGLADRTDRVVLLSKSSNTEGEDGEASTSVNDVVTGSCWADYPQNSYVIDTDRGCLEVSLKDDGTFSSKATNDSCSSQSVMPRIGLDEVLTNPIAGTLQLSNYPVSQVGDAELVKPIDVENLNETIDAAFKKLDETIQKNRQDIHAMIDSTLLDINDLDAQSIKNSDELIAALVIGALSLALSLLILALEIFHSKVFRKACSHLAAQYEKLRKRFQQRRVANK